MVKNKVAPPFREAEFDLYYGSGIGRTSEVLDMACDRGLVEKSGAWFAVNGERIAQGREKACEWLREHPEAMDEIGKKLSLAPPPAPVPAEEIEVAVEQPVASA